MPKVASNMINIKFTFQFRWRKSLLINFSKRSIVRYLGGHPPCFFGSSIAILRFYFFLLNSQQTSHIAPKAMNKPKAKDSIIRIPASEIVGKRQGTLGYKLKGQSVGASSSSIPSAISLAISVIYSTLCSLGSRYALKTS